MRPTRGLVPAVLAEAITGFSDEAIPDEGYPDEPFQVQWLRTPENAEGMCSVTSQHFAAVLSERGFVAYDSGLDVFDTAACLREDGAWDPARRVIRSDYPHPSNPLLGSDFGPDAYGYTDRRRDSAYPEHSVTIVELDDEVFFVDWTAAQFGYDEFPMVARWDGDRWRRLGAGRAARSLTAR